ncbi:MAG: tRNA pseudouridine(55) synthase TruB, partial [Chloroflexi bacterium]|nr:tRNA pseudouridine(55) synthase TruB [Chloroflexota bacterium]
MNGFINIDKPSGLSSYSVIRELKPYISNSKLGFVGTLDPIASGVLPVSVGFANRLSDEINSNKKEYLAKGKFGEETDTYDSQGTVTGNAKFDHINEEDFRSALSSFLGEKEQKAPIYSALRINGKRMYDLARKGIEIKPKIRKVELFSVELIDFSAPFFQIKIICGKGFYVRSLINDIGKKLNSLSHMVDLRRTLSGAFSIDSSIKIGNAKKKLEENLFKDLIIPPQEVLFGFKMVNINDLE